MPPMKTLANPKRFIIEVGENGFNAYLDHGDGNVEPFAASSSMSTYMRMMKDIIVWSSLDKTGNFHFEFKDDSPPKPTEATQ